MKKIRLKNLKLEASEMLGRNQLKTVFLGGMSPVVDFVSMLVQKLVNDVRSMVGLENVP